MAADSIARDATAGSGSIETDVRVTFANQATQVPRGPGNDNHDGIADAQSSAKGDGHDCERHYDAQRRPFVAVLGESELLTHPHM
jgi:hypothetical protein